MLISYFTFLVLHLYFILGLTVFHWEPDQVLFGYFLQTAVQLFFSFLIIISRKDLRSFKSIAKYCLHSFVGLTLYFIFIIIFDAAVKENYRSDTLLIKLLLTLDSFHPGPGTADNFFVNGFTLEDRNHFLLQTSVAFLIPFAHDLFRFIKAKKSGEILYPNTVNLLQFWFLLTMVFVVIVFFKFPVSFGGFLIAMRIMFDFVALRTESRANIENTKGESFEASQENRVRSFVLNTLVFVVYVWVISDIISIFERILVSFGALLIVLGTAPSLLAKDNYAMPVTEKIYLSIQAVFLLVITFFPALSPAKSNMLASWLQDKNRIYCTLGFTEKCVTRAENILQDKKSWPDMEKATVSLSTACDRNNARACYSLGVFYRDYIGGAKTEPGISLLQKSCDLKYANACAKLGNSDLAEKYFREQCNQKEDNQCYNFSLYLGQHNSDPQEVFHYYKKGCEEGVSASCTAAGEFLLEKGKFLKLAAFYFIKGCRSGDYDACSNAGLMYETGNGVKQTRSHAQSFYYLSCYNGNTALGCYRYGMFLQNYGFGDQKTESNAWEARQMLSKACRLGYQKAC